MSVVLRDVIREAVAELDGVSLALFTTFNFDPAFFEDNILPLLDEGMDLSTGRGIRAAERFLSETSVVVFYDADQLKQANKRLSYPAIPLRPRGFHLFHPKIIVLMNEDADSRVIVSSANLSLAAYGHNEEVVAEAGSPWKDHLARDLEGLLAWLAKEARALPGSCKQGWFKRLSDAASYFKTKRAKASERLLCPVSDDTTFAEQIDAAIPSGRQTTVTFYAPYFTMHLEDLVQEMFGDWLPDDPDDDSFRVQIVPALEKDPDGDLRVGILDDELRRPDKSYRLMKVKDDDGRRFRHAKVVWIDSSSRKHVVITGSHNCTRSAAGLGPKRRNVEASLTTTCGKADAERQLGALTELQELDLNLVKGKSLDELKEEAPRVSDFACTVLADWRKREYRIIVRPSGHDEIEVDLPGTRQVLRPGQEAHVIAFDDRIEEALYERKTFEAWEVTTPEETIRGLICELDWEKYRRDEIGESIEDFLDVWRAPNEGARVTRSSKKRARRFNRKRRKHRPDDEVSAAIADRLAAHDYLGSIYWLAGAFIEVERHLNSGECDIHDFVLTSPHSLLSFAEFLQDESEERLPLVRRWVLYTQLIHVLGHKAITGRGVDKPLKAQVEEVRQRLRSECARIEKETRFHDLDERRIPDTTELWGWFREQLGPRFDRLANRAEKEQSR